MQKNPSQINFFWKLEKSQGSREWALWLVTSKLKGERIREVGFIHTGYSHKWDLTRGDLTGEDSSDIYKNECNQLKVWDKNLYSKLLPWQSWEQAMFI